MREHHPRNRALRPGSGCGTRFQTEWTASGTSSSPTLKALPNPYDTVCVHQRLVQSRVADEVTRVLQHQRLHHTIQGMQTSRSFEMECPTMIRFFISFTTLSCAYDEKSRPAQPHADSPRGLPPNPPCERQRTPFGNLSPCWAVSQRSRRAATRYLR